MFNQEIISFWSDNNQKKIFNPVLFNKRNFCRLLIIFFGGFLIGLPVQGLYAQDETNSELATSQTTGLDLWSPWW
jgi:hypothetical protein